MLLTAPPERKALTLLCHKIRQSDTTETNKRLVDVLEYRWDRRDNEETVSRFTKLLDYIK